MSINSIKKSPLIVGATSEDVNHKVSNIKNNRKPANSSSKKGRNFRISRPDPLISEDNGKNSLTQVLKGVEECFGTSNDINLAVRACISVSCALLLKDTHNCPALILEGQSGVGKTTALNLMTGAELQKAGLTYSADSFTPASWLSHAGNVSRKNLSSIDLLGKIRHKLFTIADLAPIFGASDEDLRKNLSILTRVLDGQGYASNSGTKGRRGYENNDDGMGDYRFALLAATTPISQATWRTMGSMGNRIMFLEMGGAPITSEELVRSLINRDSYTQRIERCGKAVSQLILNLWESHGGYRSVAWDSQEDEELSKIIAGIALWVVKCKGVVASDDMSGNQVNLTDDPHRLLSLLYDLARGHAIANGRAHLTKDDVTLVVRIGLDSMPIARRHIFRALLHKGRLSIEDVGLILGCGEAAAVKMLRDTVSLGAASLMRSWGSPTVTLPKEQIWLRDEAMQWVSSRVPGPVALENAYLDWPHAQHLGGMAG